MSHEPTRPTALPRPALTTPLDHARDHLDRAAKFMREHGGDAHWSPIAGAEMAQASALVSIAESLEALTAAVRSAYEPGDYAQGLDDLAPSFIRSDTQMRDERDLEGTQP